jgi:sec-independent protein translocase protein TatA
MRNIGSSEILLLGLIIIFLFGGKKIPEFIRGVGEAVHEFRKSLNEKD